MRPKLHNPVWITISPLDRDSTIQDELADEPFHAFVRSTAIRIKAQVEELTGNERRPGAGGSEVPALAVITITTKQAERLSYTPKDGDRITKMEGCCGTWTREVAWYVKGPRGLAPGRSGRFGLVQFRATDGTPARNQNDGYSL